MENFKDQLRDFYETTSEEDIITMYAEILSDAEASYVEKNIDHFREFLYSQEAYLEAVKQLKKIGSLASQYAEYHATSPEKREEKRSMYLDYYNFVKFNS